MDSNTLLSAVAITISVLSVLISTGLTWRQAALMRRANHNDVVAYLSRRFADPQMHESLNAVCRDLPTKYAERAVPLSELDAADQQHCYLVAYHFQYIGNMAAIKILDDPHLVDINYDRAKAAWDAMMPHIEAERARNLAGSRFMLVYFEALATRRPAAEVLSALKARWQARSDLPIT